MDTSGILDKQYVPSNKHMGENGLKDFEIDEITIGAAMLRLGQL